MDLEPSDGRRVRITLPRLGRHRVWVWPAVSAALVTTVVAAGAVAAIETDTVSSFWRGLWWSISLVTTVGFIGEPPRTVPGAVLSVVLMVVGFLLLATVSASLAALFVREDDAPHEVAEASTDAAVLTALRRVEARLAAVEAALGTPTDTEPGDGGTPGGAS